MSTFYRYSYALCQVLFLIGWLAIPNPSYANPSFYSDLKMESISIRSRISEKTLLGEDAPEDFEALDLSLNVQLPRHTSIRSDWNVGTGFMASAGILRGANENALTVSAIPELLLNSPNNRYSFDLGVGAALLSRYRFGSQDFGGPFQFALTAGARTLIVQQLGIGYRFLHYSDAGLNGPGTTGVDFHMLELIYKL